MKKIINISYSRFKDPNRPDVDYDTNFRFVIKNIFIDHDYIFNLVPLSMADYVIYFGHETRANGLKPGMFETDPTHSHIKILVTWEPPSFDSFDDYDWIYSWCYDDMVCKDNHLRVPFYYFFRSYENIKNDIKNIKNILCKKTEFCHFVYSREVEIRNEFFRRLSKYKKIDAPGKCCNNMPVLEKPPAGGITSYKPFDFLSKYKFSISFENSSFLGYTSEKILESSLSGAIPIYWGNPCVHRDFNINRIIEINENESAVPVFGKNRPIHDYAKKPSKLLLEKMDEAIERIIILDNNYDMYIEMASLPYIDSSDIFYNGILKRTSEIFG